VKGKQAGSTLLETLVVLAIMGIALGIGSMYLRPIERPLESGAALVESLCRQARTSAIATTSAYRVRPGSAYMLLAEQAASCSETTWTVDNTTKTQLPQGVTVTSTSWTVCFSSRGISTDNQKIQLQHDQFGTIVVEVLLGGTTRVIE
jgi:prepilin-type N-terminal cleavage/methylation domain-containing protein